VDVKGSTPVDAVVRLLDTSSIDGPRVVSVHRRGLESFDPGSVDVPIGLSIDQHPDENVELAAKSDCEYVHVHYPLCLETDVVERAHAAGLAVDAWTVSDAATVRRLAERGVDAVTVDTRSALE
jgi:glycerophosphoryl diester phosphodiesterase